MNPLQHRLASLRQRLLFVNFWRGMCSLFAVAAGAVLLEGLLDYWLQLPSILRALLLVGSLAATGAVAIFFLIAPLTRRTDDLTLALKVEEVYPELNDVLASAVQFLDEPEENLPGSKVLQKQAIELAEKRTANCDFNIILDRRGVLLLGLAALVVALGAGFFAVAQTSLSTTAVCRLAVPFGGYTWTELNVETPAHKVGQGQPFKIQGKLGGLEVAKVRVEIKGVIKGDVLVSVTKNEGVLAFDYPLDMAAKGIGKFSFRVTAGDAVFPARGDFDVDIMPPPRLTKLNDLPSPQIELNYPAYTGLPAKALSPGQGHVEAVAGTRVTWRAAVDRPVTEAKIILEYARPETVNPAVGKSINQGQKPPEVIPCKIEGDGKLLSVEFMPLFSGSYDVHFSDADGLGNDYKNELRIFADPPPMVTLAKPSTAASLLPEADVNFQALVTDETFAVRSVWLEFRRRNADGVWIDKEQKEMWVEPSKDRPQRLDLAPVWPLANRFKEGETVVIRVCADDYNDLVLPKPIGKSHDVEIHIVSKPQLDVILNDKFREVTEDIVRLKKEQDDALKLVKDAQDDKTTPADKHKMLVEAETKQRQIQEAVGTTPDEGVRKKVADLQQMMTDNKLKPSSLKDKAATVASELDRVARNNLDQIESKLAEARRQMTESGPNDQKNESGKNDPKNQGPDKNDLNKNDPNKGDTAKNDPSKKDPKNGDTAKSDPSKTDPNKGDAAKTDPSKKDPNKGDTAKTAPKKEDPLKEAIANQVEADKTFKELAEHLSAWASLQDIAQGLRERIDDQKGINNDTKALKNKIDGKSQDDIARDEAVKNELKRMNSNQQALTEKAKTIVKTIDDAQKNQKEQNNTEAVEKLAEAAAIAKKENLVKNMDDIRGMLDKNHVNQASDAQKKAIDTMNKMKSALEQQDRQKEVLGLRKKVKEAEKKVEEMNAEMKNLQAKMQKAKKIANPEERAKEMEKLGKEQEELQQQLQEEARELSRLRAEKASRDLDQAVQMLDKAGKKMKNGEDADDEMKAAQQRLDKAKQDLEQADQQLAREQQAMVAERIAALKERQDAAIIESERIHSELKRKNTWSNGLLTSLKDSAAVQEGLAQEAETLKEKLDDAPVFGYIFKRAKASMNKAAGAIKERQDASKEREVGEPLDKAALAEENKAQDKVVRLQKDSSEWLGDLLDALKQEQKAAAQKPADEKPPKDGDKQAQKPDEAGKKKPQVPSEAEIKGLIKIQERVMNDTKEFDGRHPDRSKLSDDEKLELQDLETQQTQIRELFSQLTNPAPAPREKEDKGDEK